MIINATYYSSGSLHIPSNDMKSRTRNGDASPANELCDFINVYERELIINALSADLWQSLNNNINSTGVLKNDAPDWVNHLVEGYSYEIDGKSKVWDGLNHSQSCLVYYVFSKWFADNLYSNTAKGLSRLKDSGSIIADPTDFYQNQWNTFVSKYQNDSESYNTPVLRHYSSGTLLDYYNPSNDSSIVTFLQFLCDYEKLNEGTYSNLTNKTYERLNSFGL